MDRNKSRCLLLILSFTVSRLLCHSSDIDLFMTKNILIIVIVMQNLVSWYCNKSVEHDAPASLGGRGLDGEGCQLLAGGGRGEAGSDPHRR